MRRSRLRVNPRRSYRLLVCTCAWFALDASLVQGQFIPRSGTSTANVRNPGLVGNTGVSRNSMYLRTNRARFGGGDPTGGNYVGAGGRASSVGSGRAWGSRSPLLTGGDAFVSGPATSHFARVFARPQVSGAHLFTTSRAPLPVPLSRRNAHLLHRMVLTSRFGNTAPARRPGRGRRIRDALSQQSLDNIPPPESYLENLGKRRSYVDMLAERIAAEHARAIREGWEFLRVGDYRRAILRFEAAETADRNDPEATVGIVCAAVTDKSHELAHTTLRRMVERGHGVFDVEIDLRDKHSDPEFITRMITGIRRLARQNPADLNLGAMSAFLLWFSGERDEALRIADRIHEEYRTSPFASMAAQMRGESMPPQDGFSMTSP